MREIKFRAWDSEAKVMSGEFSLFGEFTLMGTVHDWQMEIRNIDTVFENGDGPSLLDMLGELKIMQFTGLKDKNGKEIYSGDLYEVAGNKVYEVRYIDKMQVQSGGFETYGACFVLWISEELFFPFDEYAMEHGKVIGNIYETPTP